MESIYNRQLRSDSSQPKSQCLLGYGHSPHRCLLQLAHLLNLPTKLLINSLRDHFRQAAISVTMPVRSHIHCSEHKHTCGHTVTHCAFILVRTRKYILYSFFSYLISAHPAITVMAGWAGILKNIYIWVILLKTSPNGDTEAKNQSVNCVCFHLEMTCVTSPEWINMT